MYMQQNLYCPTCKTFPDKITIIESESVVEIRKWNGEYYERIHSNSGDIKSTRYCHKCKTELEEK